MVKFDLCLDYYFASVALRVYMPLLSFVDVELNGGDVFVCSVISIRLRDDVYVWWWFISDVLCVCLICCVFECLVLYVCLFVVVLWCWVGGWTLF